MPAILRSIELINVGGGIVHLGDSVFTTPKLAEKTFGGSGGFNTGGFVINNTASSTTNIVDPDVIDEPMVENN